MKILKKNFNNGIAILALLISIITLYLTHLESFSLEVHDSGRFSLSVNPKNSSQMAISPSLIFSNHGAKDGIIENLAIIISSEDQKQLLIPFIILTDSSINSTQISKPMAAMPFSGFSLASKETTEKRIMFMPQSSQPFILKPGDYQLEIFVKSSKNKKFEETNKMAIQIDPIDIKQIFKNIPQLKPGESAYVEKAYFQDKTTQSLDDAYQDLAQYLKK